MRGNLQEFSKLTTAIWNAFDTPFSYRLADIALVLSRDALSMKRFSLSSNKRREVGLQGSMSDAIVELFPTTEGKHRSLLSKRLATNKTKSRPLF